MITDAGVRPLEHIRSVLIANRGEIAVRCIRACRELGIRSVAVLTHADASSLHAQLADEAVVLPGEDSSAYTDSASLLTICKQTGVDAILPGYGFLSENADFADAVSAAGITFVGPSAASIRAMGLKHEARALATAVGVPVIPGTSLLKSATDAAAEATRMGFPVMLKATGGGGGMGMQICSSADEVRAAWAGVESRAETLFKNRGVFLEKYYPRAHHIEVQVAGNGDDIVVAFGERECSIQRRQQKLVEETPSPFVEAHPGLRERMVASAIAYAAGLHYKSVGTVEFLVDDDTAEFFFLEMNTRLQVEHGITEMRYGVDLVHLMLQQADWEHAGYMGLPAEDLRRLVHTPAPLDAAIEVRIYAESPIQDFAPSPGLLQHVAFPTDTETSTDGSGSTDDGYVRVDTWVQTGQRITPLYDPLIAKIMAFSRYGRNSARRRLLDALAATRLQGTTTNLEFLSALVASDLFSSGATLTSSLASGSFLFKSCSLQVLDAGIATTIQDYPGRTDVGNGIPPGGPMDDLSARVANLLVGNAPGTEHLEMLLTGPSLLFHAPAVVAVCGAPFPIRLDGQLQPLWSRVVVDRGQTLEIGKLDLAAQSGKGGGLRAYLAIRGGFPDIAVFLGSKGTVPELAFGGMQGRALQRNDILALRKIDTTSIAAVTLPPEAIPIFAHDHVTIECMEGPYASDDILTSAGRKTLSTADWIVGHNSGRSGVRLRGPQLAWARSSGGGGGSHPSNVFDYGYPDGGVNFTGESPIIFMRDRPDLGGFVCPVTICAAAMYKVGQLRPGNKVRLRVVTYEDAIRLRRAHLNYLNAIADWVEGHAAQTPSAALLDLAEASETPDWTTSTSILHQIQPITAENGRMPRITYRQGGDTSILVEYGDQTADLRSTACVHRLAWQIATAVEDGHLPQGVRGEANFGSLTVRFDALKVDRAALISQLLLFNGEYEGMPGQVSRPAPEVLQVPVRRVRLPICIDHPSLGDSVQRYTQSIRPTAAYLPDNVEYISENNALSSRDEVFDALLKTPWLVVAVGFYVGTPILFPLDPWCVLVGQKYNPSRAFTPAGTVGLGGSLLAVYPVDAPGGYQMLGRTLGVWDATGNRPGFSPVRPWLFAPLDLVEFYTVDTQTFDRFWRDYETGRYHFEIAETSELLDLDTYIARFDAAEHDPDYHSWRYRQGTAAKQLADREQELFIAWSTEADGDGNTDDDGDLADQGKHVVNILSPMDANVWKVLVKPGDRLAEGQTVAVLEAMKMEINIIVEPAQVGTIVDKIYQAPGTIVSPGTALISAKMEE